MGDSSSHNDTSEQRLASFLHARKDKTSQMEESKIWKEKNINILCTPTKGIGTSCIPLTQKMTTNLTREESKYKKEKSVEG